VFTVYRELKYIGPPLIDLQVGFSIFVRLLSLTDGSVHLNRLLRSGRLLEPKIEQTSETSGPPWRANVI